MKRAFDIVVALLAIVIFLVPMMIIALCLFMTASSPILYWSIRVGKNLEEFNMPKFRTMKIGTPILPTDDFRDPSKFITKFGRILRKTSLDELPQLFSVLRGDMSIVGPRPVLPTQLDIIQARHKKNVYSLRPGITGWAQINGRDHLTMSNKVKLDVEYLHSQSIFFDLKIIWRTFFYVLFAKGVMH